jgi:glucosylceramidase
MKSKKKIIFLILSVFIASLIVSCQSNMKLETRVFQSSSNGDHLKELDKFQDVDIASIVSIFPENKFQVITGFGGSFTESTAHLLNQLSKKKRKLILEAYFGESGSKYSLTRTHINSCDFSLKNYSYAEVPGDTALHHFSIFEDEDDIIPLILDAMTISKDGFKIIASPWTAPPWMKDNGSYVGGKLLPEYYDTWALFFVKYIDAYFEKGINIWGITVENEPLGNGNNWESMHFTAKEMTNFVVNHLGPKLESEDKSHIKILGYDQNREHLPEWIDVMFQSEASTKYFSGTAIHWYASSYDVFTKELDYAYHKQPNKHLIQTEACVDAEIPVWKDDSWYWSKNATDWGYDWAPEEDKKYHPMYVPVYRYARDIIGCLNHGVDGWVDWNMVLDRKGGPNWFKNWCVAPVIVDPKIDEVYLTPLYYTLSHFSRFIRPGARRVGFTKNDERLLVTAAENEDGTIVAVIFNPSDHEIGYDLRIHDRNALLKISPQAIQTIIIQ